MGFEEGDWPHEYASHCRRMPIAGANPLAKIGLVPKKHLKHPQPSTAGVIAKDDYKDNSE